MKLLKLLLITSGMNFVLPVYGSEVLSSSSIDISFNSERVARKSYKVIGELQGPLTSFFEHESFQEGAEPSSLLLSPITLMDIKDDEYNHILKCYEAGHVISCLHPTKTSIETLIKIVGPETSYSSPDDGIEFYACRKTPSGFRQALFNKPTYNEKKICVEELSDEALRNTLKEMLTNSVPESKLETPEIKAFNLEDTNELQKDRANYILEWLHKEAQPLTTNHSQFKPLSFMTMVTSDNVYDLYKQSESLVNIAVNPIISTRLISFVGDAIKPIKYQSQSYLQIASYVRTASYIPSEPQKNKEDDYNSVFYLIVVPSYTQGKATITRADNGSDVREVSPVLSELVVSINPNTYTNEIMHLLTSSPSTTINATSYTSSISWSIGGNIGFFDEAATGGLSGSLTVSNSVTRTISDLTITNNSHSSPFHNDATWKFNLRNSASVSNFEPYLQALWLLNTSKINDGAGVPFTVSVEATELVLFFASATKYAKTFEIKLPPSPFIED